jgi:hypothetical protein
MGMAILQGHNRAAFNRKMDLVRTTRACGQARMRECAGLAEEVIASGVIPNNPAMPSVRTIAELGYPA